jgi:hypothetical protein
MSVVCVLLGETGRRWDAAWVEGATQRKYLRFRLIPAISGCFRVVGGAWLERTWQELAGVEE